MTIIFKYTNFSEMDRETVQLTSLGVIPKIEVASQVAQLVKNLPAQCRRHKRCGLDLWVRKIPWRRKWQPTLVCLPRKSHGQRSLVGYSPWGRKESDMTEHLSRDAGMHSS